MLDFFLGAGGGEVSNISMCPDCRFLLKLRSHKCGYVLGDTVRSLSENQTDRSAQIWAYIKSM